MELENVAVYHLMLGTHLLPVETRGAPHPRVLEAPGHILVDQPRHIEDGLTPFHGEWPSEIGLLTGDLGVHPDNTEMHLQPLPQLFETLPGGR